MVQLRKDGSGYSILKATIAEIASWGGDPELRRVHTVQTIRQGLARGAFTGKFAVCGVRGPEVVVRDFEFPALTPEEIEGAVELEVSQICPFLAEESTLDYQVTASRDKKTMGFWVAATNGLLESTRQLVSQAGLQCALVDVVGLTLLNLLHSPSGRQEIEDHEPKTEDSEPSSTLRPPVSAPRDAVLNLGDSCATIAITDPAGRPFVRDIGSGAPAEARPSLAAARSTTHGVLSTDDGWATRNDYRPTTNDSLVEDVATTLRYYAAQNGAARVDRLLVCGASADLEEFVDLLRARLNIDVEPWNPLVGSGFRVEESGAKETDEDQAQSVLHDLQQYGPSLAVAAGLAMRSI